MRTSFLTACVVGAGPSPNGKGWGKVIDDHACVVRMWNCMSQNTRDHGDKYTIGLYQISPKFTSKMNSVNIWRQPSRGWVASFLKGPLVERPNTLDVLDQTKRWGPEVYRRAGFRSVYDFRFTKGCLAALWVVDHCLPGGVITLAGFDHFKQGYAKGGRYGEMPVFRWRKHNFSVERPFLEEQARKKDVTILFLEDVANDWFS